MQDGTMDSPQGVRPQADPSESSSASSHDESLGPSDVGSPLCALGHRDLGKHLSKAAKPWHWGKVFKWTAAAVAGLIWGPSIISDYMTPRAHEVAALCAPFIGIFSVAIVVLTLLVKRWYPKHHDPVSLADCVTCLPTYIFFLYFCAVGALETGYTLEDRWTRPSAAVDLFLASYVSKQIVHLPVLFLTDIKRTQRALMLGHHALSIAACTGTLYYQRCLYYAALDGLCEMSTFFLTILYLFKETGTKRFKVGYTLNGLCLWLSFIFFRLALFPYWLYRFYSDVYQNPELTWKQGNWIEHGIYPFTTVFLLVISAYWFVPITKGFVKALTKGSDDFKCKDA